MLHHLAMLARLSCFTAPSTDTATVAADTPAPTIDAEYDRLTELLTQGITLGDEQPQAAVPILEVALAELANYAPRVAADQDMLALRASAQLSLARAHLLLGDEATATATMDEAIRQGLGERLPVDIYGPSITKLWTDRTLHASQHPGQPVAVRCKVKCYAYINERRVGASDLQALPAGTYRLWIEAADGSIEVMRREIEVDEGEQPLTIRFPPPPPPPPRTDEIAEAPAFDWSPMIEAKRDRGVMSRGINAMIGGGILLAVGGVGVGAGLGLGVPDERLGLLALGGFCAISIAPSGLVLLLAGGGSYAVAKRRSRLRNEAARLRLTPTFTRSKHGGSIGVSFAF